jgi:hypothetical protein
MEIGLERLQDQIHGHIPYDSTNRLIRVEKNDACLGECVYDGDGKRMQVTEGVFSLACCFS